MNLSRTVRILIPAVILFSIFSLAPGCQKTVVQHVEHDTTIYKDTTIFVDSNLDRQLMLSFGSVDYGNINSTPSLVFAKIYKFNKHDYSGVDSIVFMANPNMSFAGNPGFDHTDSCIVTLYNVTDNVPIAGGQFRSNNTDANVFVQTGNLYNALPDKEITLGIMIQSTKDETANSVTAAQVSRAYLFLFRK
jgi:hypothetical protein